MAVNDYDGFIQDAAREWNVDPLLIKSVMQQESGGNRTKNGRPITSTAGAGGLMQIMPKTAVGLGVSDVHDPEQAIFGSAKLLSQLLDKYQDPAHAIAAYNSSPGRVDAWLTGREQLPEETQKYIPAVTSHYAMFKRAESAQPAIQAQTVSQNAPTSDFNARWGIAAEQNPSAPAQSGTPAPAEFMKRWGIEAPANDVAPAAPSPALPANDATAPKADYTGWDVWKPPQAAPNPLSQAYTSATNALAPAPGTTYSEFFPVARNDTTGAYRPAMPGMMRSLAQGAVDLGFGPALGTVTPAATNALTMLAPGLNTSPANVPGRFSLFSPNPEQQAAAMDAATKTGINTPASRAGFAGRGPAPFPAENPLRAVEAPAFVPPGSTVPPPTIGPPPDFIPPSNALAAPTPPVNTLTAAGNRAPSLAPPAVREAAELAAIPEKLPPAPLFPPLTQSAAESRADELIRHFSAGKAVETNPDIVPDYVPKLSGLTNDPGIATLERGVQAVNPGPLGLRDQTNQNAIQNFVEKLRGAPEDVEAAQAAREAATSQMREAALSNASPVDPAPVVAQIDRVLASPEGKRTAVSKTLDDVRKSLFNADGELETEPSMLYGVRKHLNDLLDPVAQRDNPQLQQAARQLLDVKSHLDEIIEGGAPGFKDYVAKYAELSKPIDAQRYLQSLNLTDAAGNVRLAKVDSAIKAIEKQQKMPGVQKASAITDEQLAALNTLRNTLRMDQFSATAGKTLGSNTFQNLATNSRAGQLTGNPLVNMTLGGLGTLSGGPIAGIAAAGANMAAHRVLDNAESMVREAIVQRLLNHQGTGAAALTPRAP